MNSLRRYIGENYAGWVHQDLLPPPNFLNEPENLTSYPDVHILLDCESRQIFRLRISTDGKDESVFVYLYKNNSLSRGLQRSYAHRIRQISEQLGRDSIGTIEVLAALKKKGQVLNWTSVVVAREISEVRQLPASGQHILDIHPRIDFTEEISRTLGAELANFHAHDFFHGDLKSRHILYRSNTNSFCFVDLEKCGHHDLWPGILKDVLAARDMIQLLSSLPHDENQERFNDLLLSTYVDHRKLPPRRNKRISDWIKLYGPQGRFRQGKTVFENIWQSVRGSR